MATVGAYGFLALVTGGVARSLASVPWERRTAWLAPVATAVLVAMAAALPAEERRR